MPDQLPRCPATGKRSFESREAASRWLAEQADEFAARPIAESYPKYAYNCRSCRYVHVATKPPERATLSRGGRSKSRKNRRRFGGKNG